MDDLMKALDEVIRVEDSKGGQMVRELEELSYKTEKLTRYIAENKKNNISVDDASISLLMLAQKRLEWLKAQDYVKAHLADEDAKKIKRENLANIAKQAHAIFSEIVSPYGVGDTWYHVSTYSDDTNEFYLSVDQKSKGILFWRKYTIKQNRIAIVNTLLSALQKSDLHVSVDRVDAHTETSLYDRRNNKYTMSIVCHRF